MKKYTVGVLYPQPKNVGTSVLIERMASGINSNFEVIDIVAKTWSENFISKLFYIARQVFWVLNPSLKIDLLFSDAPLISGSMPAVIFKKIRKKPITLWWDDSFHDFLKDKPTSPLSTAYWEYKSIEIADSVIVGSMPLFEVAKGIRGSIKGIHYIPNGGVDLKAFNKKYPNARKKYGIPKSAIVIGFLGHIGKTKTDYVGRYLVESIAELFKKYPKLVLLIGGYGQGVPMLIERVKSLGIEDRVIFAGHMKDSQIAELISAMDICADSFGPSNLPNMRYRSSMKLKEYMAAGKASIASKVGENIEYLQNGEAGILIEFNAKELKDAVEKLIKNPALQKRLGLKAKKIAQRFDMRKYHRQFNQILEETCQKY